MSSSALAPLSTAPITSYTLAPSSSAPPAASMSSSAPSYSQLSPSASSASASSASAPVSLSPTSQSVYSPTPTPSSLYPPTSLSSSPSGSASASSAPSSQPTSVTPTIVPSTSAFPTSLASSLVPSRIPTTSNSPVNTPSSTLAASTSPSLSPVTSQPSPSASTSAVASVNTPSPSSTVIPAADFTSTSQSPISTFSSTVFVQTTNSFGQPTTFAPSEITSTLTSTLGNGGVVTFTEVVANPTLNADDSTGSNNQFLRNKGAVAAVFVIVGLAAATICLWIFFFIRRRRRRRRIDHASAVSASLAAAGYNRAPIDDDFDLGPEMRPRFDSLSSRPTINTPITDNERAVDAAGTVNLFDPYAEYGGRPVGGTGYIPARSESPSRHGRVGVYDDSYASRSSASGHVPQYITGSSDKLLSGMGTSIPPERAPVPSQVIPTPPPPPRNPKRQQSPNLAGGSPGRRPSLGLNLAPSVSQQAETAKGKS